MPTGEFTKVLPAVMRGEQESQAPEAKRLLKALGYSADHTAHVVRSPHGIQVRLEGAPIAFLSAKRLQRLNRNQQFLTAYAAAQ